MVDKDLLSIQEARTLVRSARTAQAGMANMGQEKIDEIICAIKDAALLKVDELAKMAVEDTGFGIWQDKKAKNVLASEKLYNYIKDMKTIGVVSENTETKIVEIATPVGVVAALIPSTNPTSTTIYKAMISIKAGNGVVFSPHPSAMRCIRETVDIIKAAIESCGAPAELVSVMSVPTIQGTGELMRQADMILATGGPAMVKAAYSSGTPALGVGAGNVPVFVERSANIDDAIRKIIASKTFDNGTVCASEQAIVTESVIAAQVKEALIAQGGYFLTGEKLERVKRVMERPNGGMNPVVVGKCAADIAKLAGIEIPAGTKLLVSDEPGVGPQFPFSKEKLTALLGFYVVEDWMEACDICHKLLINGGLGHSMAIHSEDESVIREFALKKPVSRMLVNTPSTHGAVGLSTNLPPSFTLGCGTVGGSSTSDNVGPQHLFNIRRLAYGVNEDGFEKTESCTAPEVNVDLVTQMIIKQLKSMSQ